MVEYIGPIITFLATIVAIKGDTWDEKKTGFFRKITVTGYVAVILAIIGFIVSIIITQKSNVQTEYNARKLDASLAETQKANNKIDSLYQQLLIAEVSLRKKSEEVARLNAEIVRSVTGGNNFCYVNLVTGDTGENSATIVVVNAGNYPLYDISFRMWDPADYEKSSQISKSLEDFNRHALIKNVGNLNPHSVKSYESFILPDTDSKSFKVTINARNGAFTELLRLRKVDGVWKRAFRVHSGFMNQDESTLLIEKADSDFPRERNGKINWK